MATGHDRRGLAHGIASLAGKPRRSLAAATRLSSPRSSVDADSVAVAGAEVTQKFLVIGESHPC